MVTALQEERAQLSEATFDLAFERLLLARTRLSSPGWAGQSIAGIAHACGFGSHASFSTAFRREFGVTPREARNGALPPPAGQAPGGVK
ncbi:helix-turn-helix domain-containing protein [Streptomyces sp. NPDC059761]|uniref:helix-turn-helix domain-containing protein n=1 Tax=Streptomyces sp. NPDC059761 TaxID=3346937 RepID=UPI0036468846